MHETDEKWMRRAIRLAREAEADGEVPVGAIIVSQGGAVLAEASNSTITNSDPTGHADIFRRIRYAEASRCVERDAAVRQHRVASAATSVELGRRKSKAP